MLRLYTLYHLNIAYSSIEEEERPAILQQCYWPLLNLYEKIGFKFNLEATGYTLQTIYLLDPNWITKLRSLIEKGICEFVGSGYAQIIGPLVPQKINQLNLYFGHKIYQELLGIQPQIALVNEQAYSSGLIKNYLEAGYETIVMEWDNPAQYHPEWNPEWRYYPQRACNQYGRQITLVWNHSIAFQKFQRFVHGEIKLNEYLSYLQSHQNRQLRNFPLYGNDTEIINYRPNRYCTERPLTQNEWSRIKHLIKYLESHPEFEFVHVSEVARQQNPLANHLLKLESIQQPVPVKKQRKYNITRWAATGRDDFMINTLCWDIYKQLHNLNLPNERYWKRLCYFWSSDFRTHITEKRWRSYLNDLIDFHKKISALTKKRRGGQIKNHNHQSSELRSEATITRYRNDVIIENNQTKVKINLDRGLTIKELFFKHLNKNTPVLGTLPHGFYDQISLGADYYSGHFIIERPGHPRLTDLVPVNTEIHQNNEGVHIIAHFDTLPGQLTKRIVLSHHRPQLFLEYQFNNFPKIFGIFRLGYLTFFPGAFDESTLFFKTHNGGEPEVFEFSNNTHFDYGQAVSYLVSANQCVGMTEGTLEIGDHTKSLLVEVDKSKAAMVGMITYHTLPSSYFLRSFFSVQEMDETSILKLEQNNTFNLQVKIAIQSKYYG